MISSFLLNVRRQIERIFSRLHHHTNLHYTKLNTKLLNWHEEFHQADHPKRWQMLKKPLLCIIAVLLIVKAFPFVIPPKIISSFPGNNSGEAPLDSKIEIVFDKGMLTSLTEKNFRISPKIKGSFSWESNQKLIFTPRNKLTRGQTYIVQMQGLAVSSFFIPLIGEKTVKFETIGDPRVILASPKAEALEDFTPVTVVFDRPMIPLTSATNSAEKKPAFSLVPNVEGEGRWLGTTAYQFRPSERFHRATTYKVIVLAGIRSQDDGVLKSGYRWEFSSERPRVIDISPLQGYGFASPVASVSAAFNQEIDEGTIANWFSLFDMNKQKVAGRILVNKNVVGFYANEPLAREKQYRVVIAKGTKGSEDPNGMEDDYSWFFRVSPLPGVISSTPINGSKDVAEQYNAQVLFKTPMDEDSFEDNVTIAPQPETKPTSSFYSYNGSNSLSISTYFGRSKQYRITIGPNVRDQYGVPLGSAYSFSFTTAPYKASIEIYPSGTYFGAFNQQVVPRVVVQVVNSKKIDYSLFKLKKEDFLDLYLRRSGQGCRSLDYQCSNWQNYDTSKLEKVRVWSESYEADLNTPVHVVTKVSKEGGDKLPSGMYFLDARIAKDMHDNMVMIVSKSTLTVKKSDSQIFVWAADQSTGDVISGMNLQLTDSGGAILSQGATNNDGVMMKDADLFRKDSLFVFGEKEDDVVVAADSWSDGINPYDFGLPSYYNRNEQKDWTVKESYKLYLTLDRPIYRPGQKIYFKGVIRKDDDGAYENLPAGEKISLEINDAQNRSIFSQLLALSSFGSFSGEFVLGKKANLGNYRISSSFQGSSFSQEFQVEEYRKPELAVTVTSTKDAYEQGEVATVDVNASYYFGSPVTEAPVEWTLQTSDYFFRWDKDWRYEFGDPDSYWSKPWWYYSGSSYLTGEKVSEGKTTTDTKGDLELHFPLDISKKKTAQRMQVEAVVNDSNNQSIASSQEFIVHKAFIYAGIKPVSYANQAGKEAKVEIVTVDQKGKEVSSIPVSIEFYKRTWETIREQNPDDGMFYYTSKGIDSFVEKKAVTTDTLGRAITSFTPSEGGTYKVVAKVTDQKGNENTSGSFLWVSGQGFSTARENNDRIVVVTDKQDYTIGENLSVFVASPYASDSAKTLLTVERGSVLDYKVVDTNDNSNNFTLPVVAKFTPNAFIGAVLVRGGNEVKKPAEFKMGYAEIKVTNKKQELHVKISPDKKRYKPRETLKATIETTDMTGRPVSAEIALGLVDKAVWDLSTVELPDIYHTFYQPRSLGVSTSQLLTISIDRINANTNLGAKGGSGGGGMGGSDTTRKNFPDTAYWNPSLKTDASGKATLEIKLPDSLTTWRLAAIADTRESAFGSSVSEVIVARDVLIRPFIPRFLSVGDEPQLGAIVVNTSGQDQKLKLTINAKGLKMNDDQTREQFIAHGGEAKVTWSMIAQNASQAIITLSVRGEDGALADSVEVKLPIKSYSVPEVVATSGEAKNTAQEKILLPKNVDKTQGEATFTFSPSLGGASIESMSYLLSYPYYCIEQTTSRFMPAIFVSRILKNAKLEGSGSLDAKALELVITDAIQRLNNEQHPDGGWGWWIESESNPFLTAYALSGLTEAKKDGYAVSDSTLQKAQSFLTAQLSRGEHLLPLNTQAYILYVLKDRGVSLTSYAANLYERRFELTLEARAYLAIAMKVIPSLASQGDKVYDELVSLAKKTATTTHWEEPKDDYTFMGSSTTTTASILEALVIYDKKNPLIPEVIRYLMSIRKDNHWSTTRDTAAVIKAVSSRLLSAGNQKVDERYRLSLNGKILTEGLFSKKDLLNLQRYVIPVSSLPIGKPNTLQVTKSGEGNLYYNMNLKYYLPFSEIKPLEAGMVVVREFVDGKGNVLSSDTLRENSEAWVRLIVVAPEERHYVVIEDMLPAGLESVNESLKNVNTLSVEKPKSQNKSNQLFYFGHKEYHDDRTTLFADYLAPGVYEIVYRVRATTPGKYHYPPAQAYQMYVPDISGHSAGGWFKIQP